MVKHIVMFKLKEKSDDNLKKLVSALEGMRGKIDSLKHLEVGLDFKGSERSYDLVLTTHFENRQGLEAYSKHEVHQPVIELARALCSNTVVVDYDQK
ncbi:MAG: Dabb family protein [Nitrospinaceae bacterium]|nr:Dabb family protein [Nitrospinaceae bacterium]NIR57259.1 Dabb family protein [Nitrospinaceae bacterium]NIS87707.1 Dabb family protein [Nitrospinaceae bacterium]NIT84573.1 Dabb family protein [Nitrospinaceae bacterium]NIU46759.1 Dabb family protein [Nitrospinaceae bacterium]